MWEGYTSVSPRSTGHKLMFDQSSKNMIKKILFRNSLDRFAGQHSQTVFAPISRFLGPQRVIQERIPLFPYDMVNFG